MGDVSYSSDNAERLSQENEANQIPDVNECFDRDELVERRLIMLGEG